MEHIWKLQEFCNSMARLDIDGYEYAYLKAIVLFSPGKICGGHSRRVPTCATDSSARGLLPGCPQGRAPCLPVPTARVLCWLLTWTGHLLELYSWSQCCSSKFLCSIDVIWILTDRTICISLAKWDHSLQNWVTFSLLYPRVPHWWIQPTTNQKYSRDAPGRPVVEPSLHGEALRHQMTLLRPEIGELWIISSPWVKPLICLSKSFSICKSHIQSPALQETHSAPLSLDLLRRDLRGSEHSKHHDFLLPLADDSRAGPPKGHWITYTSSILLTSAAVSHSKQTGKEKITRTHV